MPDQLQKELLNRAMSEKTKQENPDLDLAWLQMQSQMPKEAASVGKVKMMNPIEQVLHSGTYAVTYPWNTIAVHPQNTKSQGAPGLADILAHELTHAGHIAGRSWWDKYVAPMTTKGQEEMDWSEREATETEIRRANARRDIELPAPGVDKKR